MTSVIL